MHTKLPIFMMPLMLTGCVDQALHHVAGQIIACDAAHWVPKEEAVDFTMRFAYARELLQHPDSCNGGCQTDLATWRNGAEHGAACVRTDD